MSYKDIIFPTIFPVTCHTQYVGKDSIFVAIDGYAENGTRYIKDALYKGARAIVVASNALIDDETKLSIKQHGASLLVTDNTRKAVAQMSAEHAGNPVQKLRIIGITGTKGKTTTAFLCAHILRESGYRTALISSVHNRILDTIFPPSLTTPQPDYMHQFLRLCVENAIDYVVMEVAAQAVSLHRIEDITFDALLFTNFSHEHLEFYPHLEDYFAAKFKLFSMAKVGAPIIVNGDDEHGRKILATYPQAQSYGFGRNADLSYFGLPVSDPLHGITITVLQAQKNSIGVLACPVLFGDYNGYNVLAATVLMMHVGCTFDSIAKALQGFLAVPGRLQHYALPNGARSFIDYAHNPESFRVVLSTLRLLTDDLIVVFGAGGARDKSKRPLMGAIATTIADKVILTSDNPRLEDPEAIVNDIRAGIDTRYEQKVSIDLDRKRAIEMAYSLSCKGSIIVLLGKGPDEYQIVGTTKYYFSEKAILESLKIL